MSRKEEGGESNVVSRKINVTLYLDENLVRKEKNSGLNLSKFMENRLNEILHNAKNPRGLTWSNKTASDPDICKTSLFQHNDRILWRAGGDSNPCHRLRRPAPYPG
ncbi:hypothetical protein [[Eubacterium] cellulosolvens]